MVQENDLVIIISKSGDSPEIKVLVPLIKNFKNTVIAITGNLQGYLAINSDIIINSTVEQEACPNNLAPTTSTTAQMVMGDALAVALMELKGFNTADFARYHPGGNLGKRLYLRVEDLFDKTASPKVKIDATLKEVIVEITSKRLGATAVVDENNFIKGIITDAKTNEVLEASIELIDNEKNVLLATFKSNSTTGRYLVTLPSGKNYGIAVKRDGYLFHSENFILTADADYQEYTKDVALKKVEVGSVIVLRNIFFDCKFGATIRFFFYDLHINIGHWKYKGSNHIIDRYSGGYQAYDEAPASTLPSQILTGKAMFGHIDPNMAAFGDCNLRSWNFNQHGMSFAFCLT